MPASNPLTVHLHAADGSSCRTLRASPGQSLMRAAVQAGVEGIAADCGGTLSCATCHVVVAPEWAALLPAAGADEAAMLEMTAAQRETHSRLSCRILLEPALDGLSVRIADRQY